VNSNNQKLAEYLELIKKLTNKIIIDYEHESIREDVVHEAFIKLFKRGFFDKKEHTGKMTYIYQTVRTCYMDKLKELGFIRYLTKAEKMNTNNKYENISDISLDNMIEEPDYGYKDNDSYNYLYAKEAYQWIKDCFNSVYDGLKDNSRQAFFDAAFWWNNDYDMPIKDLAQHLGYKNSNPTQELNRLVKKVSNCTEPYGIVLKNPHEQIQILQEQIVNAENIL